MGRGDHDKLGGIRDLTFLFPSENPQIGYGQEMEDLIKDGGIENCSSHVLLVPFRVGERETVPSVRGLHGKTSLCQGKSSKAIKLEGYIYELHLLLTERAD